MLLLVRLALERRKEKRNPIIHDAERLFRIAIFRPIESEKLVTPYSGRGVRHGELIRKEQAWGKLVHAPGLPALQNGIPGVLS